jgi:hypothetical protein
MHFRRRARLGCQKSVRIKLLVNNMLGKKAMSITYFIKIAVEDEKRENDEKYRQRCGCRRCIVSPAAKPSMQLPSRRF